MDYNDKYMHEEFNLWCTKTFLWIAAPTGVAGTMWAQLDVQLGVILKLISITSFSIVIVINFETFIQKIIIYKNKIRNLFKP